LTKESLTTGISEKRERDARSVEVRLPASTSNLGAGFDCFGLALQLYLTARATIATRSKIKCRVRIRGKETASLPRSAENLIYRAMADAARREALTLPPVQLAIHNDIPVSRGLGGSAAAIVAGIKLFELLCQREMPDDKVLRYATEFEGHADNVAATLLGGFIVTCISRQGEVITVKRPWPSDVKIVVVAPELQIETKLARAALPRLINHVDGVFNLQRVALFNAALQEARYDLLWEAMQDRLHQQKRQDLVPGLAAALATPKMPGLLGLALSGAGPGILALAQENFDEIGKAIAGRFKQHGIRAKVSQLEIDNAGCQGRVLRGSQQSTRAV
jgi:homoserine kinase